MVTEYTPAISLEKPDYQDTRYDLPLNRNFDKIDSLQGKLAEIAVELSSTVPVDVFVYDTTKDSDGGLWRERCENLAWYQETLETSTRGVTRKIPAIVSIIAEATLVTLYDLTNPAVPMWRVHDFTGYTVTSVFMLQGKLIVGTTVGLYTFDYLSEEEFWYTTSSTPAIVNDVINDTAMTILPGAPIDDLTGIQVPTIAVATDGGVSIIDGPAGVDTVVGIENGNGDSSLTLNATQLSMSSKVNDTISVGAVPLIDANVSTWRDYWYSGNPVYNGIPALLGNIPERLTGLPYSSGGSAGLTLLKEDTLTPSNGMVNYMTDSYLSGWMQGDILMATLADTVEETIGIDVTTEHVTGWTNFSGTPFETFTSSGKDITSAIDTNGSSFALSNDLGLTIGNIYQIDIALSLNSGSAPRASTGSSTNATTGDLAYLGLSSGSNIITFKYETAGQNYLWLSNNAVGDWSATITVKAIQNLAENGEFSSDRAWTKGVGWSIASGVASCDGTQTGSSLLTNSASIDRNAKFRYSITVSGRTAGGVRVFLGNVATGYFTADGTYTGVIGPDQVGSVAPILVADVDFIGSVDGVSYEELDVQDRSVNQNHLQVIGELTKTHVADGAEIVAYSGFAADNYIEQPYNSDLDFGTGDFYIMGWFDTLNALDTILERDDIGAVGPLLSIIVNSSGYFRATVAGSVVQSAINYADGINRMFVVVRISGVVTIYLDGIEVATGAAANSVTNTSAIIRVGVSVPNSSPWTGSLSLLRMGAGAPSDEQIFEIYETERELFREDAKCTLKSSVVQALAWNEDKQELLVGTDSGLNKVVGVVSFDEPLSITDSVGVINETTDDDYNSISSQGDFVIHGVSTGSIANSPETNLRAELAVVGGKRQVIDFVPQDPGVPFLEGRVFYEKEHRSLSVFTDIYGVTHNLGQELLLRVYNDSGATILNGTACRHDGAEAATGFPKIVLALADTFRNAQVIGIATHDIPDETFGFINRSGIVHELDVNGIAVGYPIYLSSTVAGELVGAAPDIISRLGYVLVAGATGRMLTEIHNNIVLPTLFGLLQAIPDTDVYTLSTTPADMDGYVTDYDTGITVVGSTGYMTIPNSGWYRLTFSVTATVTPGSPAQEHNVKFDLYRTNNTPGIVAFTTLTLPSDSVNVTGSRSATIPFQATAGDILVAQVSSSDSTEDLTFDSSSFDIESISIA